ncbi:MAG: hypothetical protein WKF73_19610 [Nocardioidaceae bacterium]
MWRVVQRGRVVVACSGALPVTAASVVGRPSADAVRHGGASHRLRTLFHRSTRTDRTNETAYSAWASRSLGSKSTTVTTKAC